MLPAHPVLGYGPSVPRAPHHLRCFLWVGAGLFAAAPVAAQDPRTAQVEQVVHERVTAAQGYRLHFPGEVPVGERERWVRLPSHRGGEVPVTSVGIGIARLLLTAFGVVMAGLVVAWFVRRWLGHLPPPSAGARLGASTGRAAPVVAATDPDLDRLVGLGDYGEAIHLLLKRALVRLHNGVEPPPALTARAALRSLSLEADTRAGLRVLVEAVEQIRYAGEAPDRTLYVRCRAASEVL